MRAAISIMSLSVLMLLGMEARAQDTDTPQKFHGGAEVTSPYDSSTGGFFTELLPTAGTGFTFRRRYVLRLINVSTLLPYVGYSYDVNTRADIDYERVIIEVPGMFWMRLTPASPEVAEAFEQNSSDTRLRRLTFSPLPEETIELLLETCAGTPPVCP